MNPQRTASDILDKRKNLLKAVESALIGRPQHMIDWPKVNLKAQTAAQQAYRIASFFLTGARAFLVQELALAGNLPRSPAESSHHV